MTLPNFLGIGAQRCGTSWLHESLRKHPAVFLPEKRKEIHYFDQYYDRGVKWYEKYFPENNRDNFKAIGEITPRYIYEPEVPARIYELLPECKFIVILRNPADRLFSQYLLSYGSGRTAGTFMDFVSNNNTAESRGMYAEQLERYLEYYPITSFKILIFEELFSDRNSRIDGLMSILEFLGIDSEFTELPNQEKKINAGHGQPRYGKAFKKAIKVKRWLRDHDLDWITRAVRSMGAGRGLFGKDSEFPEFSRDERARLIESYEPSIRRLESLIERNLDIWRNN